MHKLKVVLDTNVLLYIEDLKFDIFSEIERVVEFPFEICVMEGTIKELEKLINEGNLKEKRSAKFAIQLIKTKNLKIIKTVERKNVDEQLLTLGKNYIIVTQDKELKKKLKEKGMKVLTIRKKSLLVEG